MFFGRFWKPWTIAIESEYSGHRSVLLWMRFWTENAANEWILKQTVKEESGATSLYSGLNYRAVKLADLESFR